MEVQDKQNKIFATHVIIVPMSYQSPLTSSFHSVSHISLLFLYRSWFFRYDFDFHLAFRVEIPSFLISSLIFSFIRLFIESPVILSRSNTRVVSIRSSVNLAHIQRDCYLVRAFLNLELIHGGKWQIQKSKRELETEQRIPVFSA